MKILVILFTLTFSTNLLFAQQFASWQGGTPGQETNWNEARNWSNYKVPDAFSNVLIPDVSTTTFSAPVIEDGIVELNSILIESNAQLQVDKDAILIIHDHATGLELPTLQLAGCVIFANAVEGTNAIVICPTKG